MGYKFWVMNANNFKNILLLRRKNTKFSLKNKKYANRQDTADVIKHCGRLP